YVAALHAGRAAGLTVKADTLKRAESFVKSCKAPWRDAAGKEQKGAYCYMPTTGESANMTAVGVLCALHFRTAPNDAELPQGFERLKLSPPGAAKNSYYEFHATQTIFHLGDKETWKAWNVGTKDKPGIRDALIRKQDDGTERKGNRGSWAPEGG